MRTTLFSFFTLLLLLQGGAALAQSETSLPPGSPAWAPQNEVDIAAFRYRATLPVVAVAVPTVVEVPLGYTAVSNTTAIVLDQFGTPKPARYLSRTYDTPVVSVRAEARHAPFDSLADAWNSTSASPAQHLIDGDPNTLATFDHYERSEDVLTIELTYAEPITTDTLTISRGQYVAAPRDIRIQVADDAGRAGDVFRMRDVVSTREYTGDTIRFPKTTAQQFVITLAYDQQLRLGEVSFRQEGAARTTRAVRYLANPGDSYTLYIDPDRDYGSVDSGGVMLTSSQDVAVYEGIAALAANPAHAPADRDGDRVPDALDNCPNVPNELQEDANGNGRGDACDDHDRDGRMTSTDNCPDTPNRDQRDTDGDGVGDACDTEESRFTEANPWVPWVGIGIAGLVLLGLLMLVARDMKQKDGEVIKEGEA